MDVPNGDQNFQVRRIVVAPGAERPYDEAEWKDALVVIESGKLELESRSGNRSRFDRGDVLWLIGLPLRVLRNAEPCRPCWSRSPGSGPLELGTSTPER